MGYGAVIGSRHALEPTQLPARRIDPASESNVTGPCEQIAHEQCLIARRRKPVSRWSEPRSGLLVPGFASIVLLFGCVGEDPATEPEARAVTPTHVVLITLDTTRADALGVYGQPSPTTPHIDRMSGEGLRFAQVMSSAPSTFPSHATILTGKFPYAHGVRSNSGYVLPTSNETLPEVLSNHGFATAAEIAAPVIGSQTGLDQGFAVYRDTVSPDVELKVVAMVSNKDAQAATTSQNVVHLEERMATDITNRGIDFIEAHRNEKTFLWLHYFDPHRFYAAPPEFRARIPDPYLAEVSYVDSEIGRLLDTIRRLELEPDTLVVLTADHGEGRGQHDEDNHAFFVYDTTMRVPLVMWGSSVIRRGSLVDSLVRTADIAPTILDLLGLPPLEGIQGQSLAPLITGSSKDLGLTGYGESAEFLAFGSSMIRSVREGQWKYIHKLQPELYDVVTDPGEESNLAPSRPEVVERLRSRMAELIGAGDAGSGGADVPLDAEMRERLQGLGYAATTPSLELKDSLSNLNLVGTDPSEHVADIRLLSHALGAKKQHRYDKAAVRFGSLWRKFHAGSFGLFQADALIQQGQFEEAVALLEEIVALFPDESQYLVALGDALMKAGRNDEARTRLVAALESTACDSQARALLAHLSFVERNYRAQHEILRVGAEECPKSLNLWNNYAYALATCPEASQRNGEEALRLALAVTEGEGGERSGHVDTLAAAHAELGNFAAATAASKRSIELESARAAGRAPPETAHLEALNAHLEVFTAGRPLRDPAH